MAPAPTFPRKLDGLVQASPFEGIRITAPSLSITATLLSTHGAWLQTQMKDLRNGALPQVNSTIDAP